MPVLFYPLAADQAVPLRALQLWLQHERMECAVKLFVQLWSLIPDLRDRIRVLYQAVQVTCSKSMLCQDKSHTMLLLCLNPLRYFVRCWLPAPQHLDDVVFEAHFLQFNVYPRSLVYVKLTICKNSSNVKVVAAVSRHHQPIVRLMFRGLNEHG